MLFSLPTFTILRNMPDKSEFMLRCLLTVRRSFLCVGIHILYLRWSLDFPQCNNCFNHPLPPPPHPSFQTKEQFSAYWAEFYRDWRKNWSGSGVEGRGNIYYGPLLFIQFLYPPKTILFSLIPHILSNPLSIHTHLLYVILPAHFFLYSFSLHTFI